MGREHQPWGPLPSRPESAPRMGPDRQQLRNGPLLIAGRLRGLPHPSRGKGSETPLPGVHVRAETAARSSGAGKQRQNFPPALAQPRA